MNKLQIERCQKMLEKTQPVDEKNNTEAEKDGSGDVSRL